ncbi:MAG TPA: lipid IV(A) 3-deoxy-D-manno-octulosonic acid transferase [Steroidobacteraceae bacterium]|nr:lipid IV(A) 3-deoxy-D-manno-octulosonic acid transferase [Steroidobacteraceae bacterium]
MRRLYTLLVWLALPALSLRVLLRGLREREYWQGGWARFGFGTRRPPGGIWVHAVSVGEVQAAAVLIAALRAHVPGVELTLSCATPTGRARARAVLPGLEVRFAPYDTPGCVGRAFARLRPRLLVVLETELWPNLLRGAWRRGIPTLIASARISQRTARIYARLPGLLRDTLAANVWVGAQSVADAERFAALGVDPARLSVVGNLKFERTMPAEIGARGARARARYAPDRPVWTAGSTHAGEEAILLAAHRLLRAAQPRALLVLAPRHPERFDALAAAIAAQGFRCQRRSRDLPQDGADPDSEVLLLDTLGELPEFYAAADVAFVGGSLVPAGGHNLLEPAALALPVLAGPALFSAPDVAQALRDAGALTIVQDAGGLAAALRALLDSPAERARSGAAGRAVIEANRGALERLLRLIDPLLAMPL